MRASHRDLIHAHSLATVAPSDLGDLYTCAAVCLIKPPIDSVSVEDVFQPEDHIILRSDKSVEELGLTMLEGFQWREWTTGCHSHKYGYTHPGSGLRGGDLTTVYCRSTNISAIRLDGGREYLEFMTLLDDDDEYLVIKNSEKIYVVRLPA